MGAFEDFIMNGDRNRRFSGDQLTSIGKEVSHKYLKDNLGMTDEISKIAEERGLNADQVARVVEAANVETFTQLFNRDYDVNVSFDVAEPSPAAVEPPVEKVAGFTGRYSYHGGTTDADLFPQSETTVEKVASAPTQDLSLIDEAKHLASDLEKLASAFELQVQDVKDAVNDVLSDGVSEEDVATLVASADSTGKLAALIELDGTPKELQGYAPNVDHPVYRKVALAADTARESVRLVKELATLAANSGNMQKHVTKIAERALDAIQ